MTTTPRTARESRERESLPRPAMTRKHNGLPALFLIENARLEPVAPLVADIWPDTPAATLTALAGGGVTLFRLRGVDASYYWTGTGKTDFSAFDRRLAQLFAAVPTARVLLEIGVNAPDWWLSSHQTEQARYQSGETPSPDAAEPSHSRPTVVGASWASRAWRSETGEALARFLRHVGQLERGSQVVGVHLTAGAGGEWRHEGAAFASDASGSMIGEFRAFCLDKYRRNEGLLRKAWFDARAKFDTIAAPTPRDLHRGNLGILRNPSRSRPVFDYYEAYAQAQNEAALHFCGVVKRASDRQMLVGLAYAPVFCEQTSGDVAARDVPTHAFFDSVLDSADVDFFVANAPTDGNLYIRALTGSLALREKFLFHAAPAQMPAGTPSAPPASAVPASNALSPADTLFAQAGLAQSYHAGLIVSPDADPGLLRTIRAQMERALRTPGPQRKRVSPIAVFVDPAATGYLATEGAWLHQTLLSDQIRELTQLGAPFDVYMLSDLFATKLPLHKVTLFLNLFYLSEPEHRRLDARIKRTNQTAVWLWGGGMIGEDSISAELGQRACGQRLRLEPGGISLRARVAEANDALMWGQHVGVNFGSEHLIAPTITVADKDATRLGANTANKTVSSVLRLPTWTSVVFGTLPIPAYLLRNVLKAAGCHLYLGDNPQNAVVFADSRLLTIASPRAQSQPVFLPGRHEVLSAAADPQRLFADVSDFTTPNAAVSGYELRSLVKPKDEAKKPDDEDETTDDGEQATARRWQSGGTRRPSSGPRRTAYKPKRK